MFTYDLMNAYLHLILGNETTFLQMSLSSYENFVAISDMLIKKDNCFFFLKDIEKEQYALFQRSKEFKTMEAFFEEKFTSSLRDYIHRMQQKYQVIFLHGFDKNNPMNQLFVDEERLNHYQNEKINMIYGNHIIDQTEMHFNAPSKFFLKTMYYIDLWPGILVIKDDQYSFHPVHSMKDIDHIINRINHNTIFKTTYFNTFDSYFIHLSDLHLGTINKTKGKEVLLQSLDTLYHDLISSYPMKFLITGDLMNSPNRKNMYEASSFMNTLRKDFKGDVTFILGNHDMIVNGLNLFKRQKTKVVAYLLDENIKVLEDEKIILIKVNSMIEGNLARGEIGQRQLDEIDEELSSIESIEDYTLMMLLHHHVLPIKKDDFLKVKWNEKYLVGKLLESSKALVDAPLLLEWAKNHHIEYIFHGHKHLPFVQKEDDCYIIASGSSCGGGAKESKSRYLSYNVLKYDHETKKMKYCFIFYDDMTLEERQHVIVHLC